MHTGGSVWEFTHELGAFEVEFRADALNHFVCSKYPADAHWEIDPQFNRVNVNWGIYGEYELTLGYENGSYVMNGCKKGQPRNWRRLYLVRTLGVEGLTVKLDGPCARLT